MEIIQIIIFFILVFVYFGYPFTLILINFFTKKQTIKNKKFPSVSIVLPVYNESRELNEKINNIDKYDYKGILEIVIVVDGQNKELIRAAKTYNDTKKIKLIIPNKRIGKTMAQNIGVDHSTGEIILFTDVRSKLKENALEKLVTMLNDNIGSVTGTVLYQDEVASEEGLYIKYENKIRELESSIRGTIVASGSILLFRKKEYISLPPHVVNDIAEPLAILLSHNKPLKYAKGAICYAKSSGKSSGEIVRHRRTIAQFIFTLGFIKKIFNVFRYGYYSYFVLVHKILRFVVPFLFIALLVLASLNVFWAGINTVGFVTLILLMIGTLAAFLGFIFDKLNVKAPAIITVFYHFFNLNLAALLAWADYLRGNNYVYWEPKKK